MKEKKDTETSSFWIDKKLNFLFNMLFFFSSVNIKCWDKKLWLSKNRSLSDILTFKQIIRPVRLYLSENWSIFQRYKVIDKYFQSISILTTHWYGLYRLVYYRLLSNILQIKQVIEPFHLCQPIFLYPYINHISIYWYGKDAKNW